MRVKQPYKPNLLIYKKEAITELANNNPENVKSPNTIEWVCHCRAESTALFTSCPKPMIKKNNVSAVSIPAIDKHQS